MYLRELETHIDEKMADGELDGDTIKKLILLNMLKHPDDKYPTTRDAVISQLERAHDVAKTLSPLGVTESKQEFRSWVQFAVSFEGMSLDEISNLVKGFGKSK